MCCWLINTLKYMYEENGLQFAEDIFKYIEIE